MKVEALTAGDLKIEPAESGAMMTLTWTGKGTERSPSTTITPWLINCLTRAKEISSGVCIDVSAVDHMNSASITTVVQIIREARSRDVKLVIKYDEKKSWQELSFGALSMFVKDDGLFALEKS